MTPACGHVCFFDPDTYPGVYNSCNILVEQGWQVDVICLETSGFGGKVFDPRVRLHRIENRAGDGRRGGAVRFAKLIRQTHAFGVRSRWDMVFGHDMHGLVASRLSSVVPPSRVAFWSQDLAEPSLLGLGQRAVFALKRRFIRSCAMVIAPSRTRAEALRRFFPLRTEPLVVYNSPRRAMAVADEQWRQRLGIPETTPMVVYAGGLGQDRRVPELVESVVFWPRESALVMAGYGRAGAENRLRALAHRAGVSERVHIVGHLPSVFGLVREAEVGVSFFPTQAPGRNRKFRGLASNKLFEYIAMGVPVVVTANCETQTFMNRFGCGVCVLDHSPRGIAKAIGTLLEDKGGLASAAENARRTHYQETYFEKRFTAVSGFLASRCFG